ncbi:molecular chaperone DnaJ [Novosphingobium bradum]|uniref:Molecular chaperone DnaJ n=1 Tax=Novosphingobium bradum TaxID=1737444 RepID=A0ABV7IUM4_9SPHN
MARLLFLLAVASVLCRMAIGRWPWQVMGQLAGWELPFGPGRSSARARARALLGVGRDANRIDIITAHKRLVAVVHPDRGGTTDQVHEANAARDLLLADLSRD